MHFTPIILALLPSLALVTPAPIIRNINDPNAVHDYSHEAAKHLVLSRQFGLGLIPPDQHGATDPALHAARSAYEHTNHLDDHLKKALKAENHQKTVPTGPDLDLEHPHAEDYHRNVGNEHDRHAVEHRIAANRAHQAFQRGGSVDTVTQNIKSHVRDTTLSKKHADHADHHHGRAERAEKIKKGYDHVL